MIVREMIGTKSVAKPYGKTVGMAILSWKAWATIKATLDCYLEQGIFAYFDDVVLCFQEICDTDRALAAAFGIRFVGSPTNTGIQGGHELAWNSLQTDFVLILENDIIPCETHTNFAFELSQAIQLLVENKADLVRLRNRFQPGQGVDFARTYSAFWQISAVDPRWCGTEVFDVDPQWKRFLRRCFRPFKARRWAGRSVYIEREPNRCFPHLIRLLASDVYHVDSAMLPWTNQSTLISHTLMGRLFEYAQAHPSRRTIHGFQDLERPLNCAWWQRSHFRIACPIGCFTHQRLDR
ncbi:MAG: hypothetical protein RSB14_05520 [Kiritimatiellia bacterium]